MFATAFMRLQIAWRKRARQSASPLLKLEAGYVRSLQALGAAGNFEFNRLAFVQRFVAFSLNSGEVDENVLAGLALDESKALTSVEPLYGSLFFQLCFSFLIELFGAFPPPLAQQKKGLQVWTCSPSIKSKGFTRATNAPSLWHGFDPVST
jgi:hypothetical protein